MFIAGVLLFSLSVSAVSYMLSKSEALDRGKIAVTTVLVAWGSMLIGLLLSKVSQ